MDGDLPGRGPDGPVTVLFGYSMVASAVLGERDYHHGGNGSVST